VRIWVLINIAARQFVRRIEGNMDKSLYLINPRSGMPGYFGAEVFEAWGLRPATSIADLATTTVAALAPANWDVSLCDEQFESVEFDTAAEFVGLTGKVTQASRLIELANEFRRRGKTVIAGGPYASLSPAALREHVDILVIGEMESVAARLFSDLDNMCWSPEYVGGRWGLSHSPMPRWSLYRNDRALVGCVQTSRGCPFDCEFCDVIAYLGHKQRHKPTDQVLAELDVLYGLGYRNVFIADDNFTAYRRHARELLHALEDWNRSRTDGPMMFGTQLSIDAARDSELVRQCASAGIDWVFIGIETPNEASLRECKKPQNLLLDLQTGINSFLANGIAVTGGMIVGFDHDGPDIFRRQHDFAMASAVPIFSIGALVAPAATPLYNRMQNEHRLIEGGPEVAALPWDTNIIPAQMSREELLVGMRWLCNSLYDPRSFSIRLTRMIDMLAPHPLGYFGGRKPRHVEMDGLILTKKLASLGVEENELIRTTMGTIKRRPHAARAAMTALFRYAQLRCMYKQGDFWEPRSIEPDCSNTARFA
jgi:hypothetical protein